MTGATEGDTAISVSLAPNGVVRLRWVDGLQITGPMARAAMRRVDDINAGHERPLLVDMTGTAVLCREARQAFGVRCSASRIALLGESAVHRVIANFQLGVGRLPVPTKFFTSETAAIDWLRDDRPER